MVLLSEKQQQYLRCLERLDHDNRVYRICGWIMAIYTGGLLAADILYIIVATYGLAVNISAIQAEYILGREPKVMMVNMEQVFLALYCICFFIVLFFSNRVRKTAVSLSMIGLNLLIAMFFIVCAVCTASFRVLHLSLALYCITMAVCFYFEIKAGRDLEALSKCEGYPQFNALLLEDVKKIPELPDDASPEDMLMYGRNGGRIKGKEASPLDIELKEKEISEPLPDASPDEKLMYGRNAGYMGRR